MQTELFNLYKKLSNSDIVFHYTKVETALNHILDTTHCKFTLRMSNRTGAVDLWEQNINNVPIKFDEPHTIEDINNPSLVSLHKEFVNSINGFNQVSFCMNNRIPKTADKGYLEKNLDRLGFLKSRMWDQYGNGYKGVCLAFSKSKLIANNPDTIHRSVVYKTLDKMPKQSFKLTSKDITEQKFKNIFNQRRRKILFSKTLDYRDENEFRIGSFSDSFLNIDNGLKAIIFIKSDDYQHPQFVIRSLADYARIHQIDCIELRWNKNKFGHIFR